MLYKDGMNKFSPENMGGNKFYFIFHRNHTAEVDSPFINLSLQQLSIIIILMLIVIYIRD